LSAAFP